MPLPVAKARIRENPWRGFDEDQIRISRDTRGKVRWHLLFAAWLMNSILSIGSDHSRGRASSCSCPRGMILPS